MPIINSSSIAETKSITENGLYDVARYTSADVNVEGTQPVYTRITLSPSRNSGSFYPEDFDADGFSEVSLNAVTSEIDGNIQAGNIKKDVTILGVTGNYEGSGGGGGSSTKSGLCAVAVSIEDPDTGMPIIAIKNFEKSNDTNFYTWETDSGSHFYSKPYNNPTNISEELTDEWTFRAGESYNVNDFYFGGIKGEITGKIYFIKNIDYTNSNIIYGNQEEYPNEFYTVGLSLPSVGDNIYFEGEICDTVELVYDSTYPMPIAFQSEYGQLYYRESIDVDRIWWKNTNDELIFTPMNKILGPMRIPIYNENGELTDDHTGNRTYGYYFIAIVCNGNKYVYESGSSYGSCMISFHNENHQQVFIDAHDFYVGQPVYNKWNKETQIGEIEEIYMN